MEYILELRKKYTRDAQGEKRIPIYDQYATHPDYVVHPRQKVWFDIPLLRSPSWQNFQILPESFDKYIEDAIEFMKENTDVSNYAGFYDFEIEKLERNLSILQENRYEGADAKLNRINFIKFFDQYDQRKGTDFYKTFPEFKGIMDW